jgi:hypothetical protein
LVNANRAHHDGIERRASIGARSLGIKSDRTTTNARHPTVMTLPLTSALPAQPANPLTSSAELAFQERVREFSASFPAALQPFQFWLVQQIVQNAMIVDRCRDEASFHTARLTQRAQLCWNDDRRLEAEEIATRLPKEPAKTMRKLQKTRQGCEWLLERWDCLAQLMRETGEWTPVQETLARDMLGIPLELRNVPNLLDGATPEETRASRLRVAEKERTRLVRRIEERLDMLDATEKSAASRGQCVTADKALRDCRRLEAAANRRIQWAMTQLNRDDEPAESAHPSASTTSSASDSSYRAFAARLDAQLDTTELERRADERFAEHLARQSLPVANVSAPVVLTGTTSLVSATRPEQPMNRRDRRARKARNGR